MSIFRESFPDFVKSELNRRQEGMMNRTPQFVQELNTRASWIRMTSGVDVGGDNVLANQYVLMGGVLNDEKLRYGLGEGGSYDLKSPGGKDHRLGIRPMPGITKVDIQSKGAYGSLQEAVVHFNCWDIRQLEDLEMLYMRPGYTVLLEFGWNYIKPVIPYYDILKATADKDLNERFKEIYQKIEENNGNYDALIGYVKNYNWSARDDGGYDCSTTIISLGEVLESIKCNWVSENIEIFRKEDKGMLGVTAVNTNNKAIIKSYEKGVIPGLLHELWDYMYSTNKSENYYKDPTYYTLYHMFKKDIPNNKNRGGYPKPLGDSDKEIWITLGSFCDLLNNYVVLKGDNGEPLYRITTRKNGPDGSISPDSLECIADPLSISTNLGVCFVRNDNWNKIEARKFNKEYKENQAISGPSESSLPQETKDIVKNRNLKSIKLPHKVYQPYRYEFKGSVKDEIKKIPEMISKAIIRVDVVETGGMKLRWTFFDGKAFDTSFEGTSINLLDMFSYRGEGGINQRSGGGIIPDKDRYNNIAEDLYEDLFVFEQEATEGLKKGTVNPFNGNNNAFNDIKGLVWTKKSIIEEIIEVFSNFNIQPLINRGLNPLPAAVETIKALSIQVSQDSLGLRKFIDEYNSNDSKTLGMISNIYVNINYLYSQATSKNVASKDAQNDISIREYIQGIMREIQNSLGGINNFDLQADSRNTIGRIIDINFTGDSSMSLFPLEIHNLKSTVRKYGFQSKIFPEMGAIIAISAQDSLGIGKMGYDNATLVAWNEGIKDRIMPKKIQETTEGINPNFYILSFINKMYDYFKSIEQSKIEGDVNYAYGILNTSYKDFLAFKSRIDPSNKFKTIIPTELNIALDGIGGMVIGNVFEINQDIVPKGYKTAGNRKLAYILTQMGHSIENNDWITNISAYPIIMENSERVDVVEIVEDTSKTLPLSPITENDIDLAILKSLKGDWVERAYAYISKKEGFSSTTYWDVNAWRAGYGTDHKLMKDGSYQKITKDTTFTQEEAKSTLIYEIENKYSKGVIGQIGKPSWDSLNNNQKASLTSYSYNAGPGALKNFDIINPIQSKKYAIVAENIARGPITAAGKVLEGLVKRRKEESIMFLLSA